MARFIMLAATAALSLVTACGNTADGAKEDVKSATDKVSDATASAAQKTGDAMASAAASVDAAMETAAVKTALVADTRVDAGDINVGTDKDAKTVTLNGSVPTEAMKKLAGEVARDKAKGFAIVNKLTIKPKR